jgi:tRNA dimethylallyltransferase
MPNQPNITLIFGPTAVGKTVYALEKALKENAEIISADSMQIYRGMDIGTGKPSAAQRAQVKHYLMDVVNPDEEFSAAKFVEYCQNDMQKIMAKGKNILIVGGTGLYLNALINGFNFPIGAKNEAFREQLKADISKKGLGYFHEELKTKDPISASKIHPNDELRITRALEIFHETGQPKSALAQKGQSILPAGYELIELKLERPQLYERINQRVDSMFAQALVDEVKALIAQYPKNIPAFAGIGYKEVIAYLGGQLNLNDCIELVKKNTRNFAKRQMTWFRKFGSPSRD